MKSKKRRTATRKRRNERRQNRREIKKLCKANAILSTMTECYKMLNTMLMDTWDHTRVHCEAKEKTQNTHVLLLYYAVLHRIPKEEASPLFKLSCQVDPYISLAALLGVVWLLTLNICFQATQKPAIKPCGEKRKKFQGRPTHTQCLGLTVYCSATSNMHAEFTWMSYGVHKRCRMHFAWSSQMAESLFKRETSLWDHFKKVPLPLCS